MIAKSSPLPSVVPRRRTGRWVGILLLVLCAGPLSSQTVLQIDRSGQGRVLNLEAEQVVQSEPFWFDLNGEPFELELVGGGLAMETPKAGFYLAGVLRSEFVFSDHSKNWKLFALDMATRSARVVMPLDRPLSALARSPSDQIVGISFRPAQFVHVNTVTGTVAVIRDLGPDQETVSSYDVGEAALLWVEEEQKYLWIHGNSGRDFLGETEEVRDWIDSEGNQSIGYLMSRPSLGPQQAWERADGSIMVLGRSAVEVWTRNGLVTSRSDRTFITRETYYGRFVSPGRAYFELDPASGCHPSDRVLCFGPLDHFSATVQWRDPSTGEFKPGFARRLTADTGVFWFVDDQNLEVMVKLLDTCSFATHYWVFGAASTDLEYTLTIRDESVPEIVAGQASVEYGNPGGMPAPAITDTAAIPCP